MRRLSYITVLVLLGSSLADAQSFYSIRKERILIGTVGVGSANYFGELTNPGSLGTVKYGLNVGAERFFTNRISARVEAIWYQISGTDEKADDDRIIRNLNFVSNNIELSGAVTVSLFTLGRRFYQRPTVNFYGFAGFGLTYINPKTEYQGEMVALQPLQTEGVKYSKFQPIIPFGGGIKLKAGPFFNVCFEGGVRKTFTDYMDDISSRYYPDPNTLSSQLAKDLSKRSINGTGRRRGNPEKDDWYFIMNVKVQYYLPFEFGNSSRKLYTKKRRAYNSIKRRRR